MTEPTRPSVPSADDIPNSYETMLLGVAHAQHGDNFDHLLRDPANPLAWIIVLKDGTTDWARIECIRPFPLRAGPTTVNVLTMADPVPAGSDVSSGTYKCTECGYRLQVQSTQHLPPCPQCNNGYWETITGGDSKDDPYPNS